LEIDCPSSLELARKLYTKKRIGTEIISLTETRIRNKITVKKLK